MFIENTVFANSYRAHETRSLGLVAAIRKRITEVETRESVCRLDYMQIDLGPVPGIVILIVTVGMMIRFVTGGRSTRGESATKLAQLEERVQKIEEATSGIVAEFAAARERERFMRQLIESKSRKSGEIPAVVSTPATPVDTTSPFVVQTVSAARRSL